MEVVVTPGQNRAVAATGGSARIGSGLMVRAGLLIVAALWIYSPAWQGGPLWDDTSFIFHNAIVRSPEGYWQAWTALDPLGRHQVGNYNPLTTTAEWLQFRMWGDGVLGYHLVNVALHIASAFLVWRLFARLGLALAWIGAALFLTHPTTVESVCWMTELKDTLSMPLILVAMLAWLSHERTGGARTYAAALGCFALSLAAKSTGMMLPVVLLGHLWWKNGRLGPAEIERTAPFFAVTVLFGLIALRAPHLAGAHLIANRLWTVSGSLACVGRLMIFTLGKGLLPIGLLPIYPGLSVNHATLLDVLPWALVFVLMALFVLGWRAAPWVRYVACGVAFFWVNLVPLFVFAAMSNPTMTDSIDHILYLPMIGLIGAAIACMEELRPSMQPVARVMGGAVVAAALVAFAVGGHAYASVFADEAFFWHFTLSRAPRDAQALSQAAIFEEAHGDRPAAIALLDRAVEADPESDSPRFDLAMVLIRSGRTEEAKPLLLQAAALNPREMRSYLTLSQLETREHHVAGAEDYIEQARRAAPNDPTPIAARAALLLQTGRRVEGIELYRQALAMDPDVEEVRYNYGVALLQAGDLSGAVDQLKAAVDLDGTLAPARENLGVALAQTGAVTDAIGQFKAALAINPSYVLARDNLALALAQTGHSAEAVAEYRKALETDPSDARARAALSQLQGSPKPGP